MPNVIFRDKLVYSFNRSAFSLQYFDSGDLHGNDNFRTQDVSVPIYEILNQIDPDILHSALAATINNKPVPLTAKITEDCTLDIITIDAPDGKMIYYRSLAFFLAQAVFLLDPSTRLTVFDTAADHCTLQFDISDNAVLSDDAIREQLEQLLSDKTAIQVISAWQKEMLLQTYPSLLQPYAQQVLKDYDDYDFVTVAVRKNFVLPVEENAIFVLSPDALRNYHLSVLQTETSLSITAAI